MCNNRDPDCWSSTVVNGRGFLSSVSFTSDEILSAPFGRRLGFDTYDGSHWVLGTLLIKNHSSRHVKQMVSSPLEIGRLDIVRIDIIFSLDSDVDVPKWFWGEILNFVPLINHETQRGELTRT